MSDLTPLHCVLNWKFFYINESKKWDENEPQTCCGAAGDVSALPSVGGADSSVGALTATSGVSTVDAAAVDTMWTDSLCRRGASCAISSYMAHLQFHFNTAQWHIDLT